jgi:hypothetical protein
MQQATLNELVIAYRSSGEGRDLILEKVAALVYDRHRQYGFDDEDDAANALLRFKERIGRLVDRFEDRGLPFDAYLAANLRYLAKTARRERRRAYERESVCERAVFGDLHTPGQEAWDLEAALPVDQPGPGVAPPQPAPGRGAAARRRPRARGGLIPRCPAEAAAYSSRLVFLAIKCAWEIGEETISQVAASAGVGREWLGAAIEQARRSMESERARVDYLGQRRNASWTRLRLLEARLAEETEPYRRSLLEASLHREADRYAKVREEFSVLRTIVPNSLVARILGVPKGTVDSGLYYLRKRYGQPEGFGHLVSAPSRRLSSPYDGNTGSDRQRAQAPGVGPSPPGPPAQEPG